MRLVFKFHFDKGVDMALVETQLIESIITSVDVFGQLRVQSSATYVVKGQEAVLETRGIVGLHTLLVFAGRLSRSIGVNRYLMDFVFNWKGVA